MVATAYTDPGYQHLRRELNRDDTMIGSAERDEKLFEQVFKTHFKNLHAYACSILKDEIIAEDIVQNLFYKLWEKKEPLEIASSITAYLYKAVYNECLNSIKHRKVRAVYQSHAIRQGETQAENVSKNISMKELQGKLEKALNDLPEQCRTIFQMSRFEELKYREIADKLDISVKTVENQMGKALKLLRIKLVEFLPMIGFLLININ